MSLLSIFQGSSSRRDCEAFARKSQGGGSGDNVGVGSVGRGCGGSGGVGGRGRGPAGARSELRRGFHDVRSGEWLPVGVIDGGSAVHNSRWVG